MYKKNNKKQKKKKNNKKQNKKKKKRKKNPNKKQNNNNNNFDLRKVNTYQMCQRPLLLLCWSYMYQLWLTVTDTLSLVRLFSSSFFSHVSKTWQIFQ